MYLTIFFPPSVMRQVLSLCWFRLGNEARPSVLAQSSTPWRPCTTCCITILAQVGQGWVKFCSNHQKPYVHATFGTMFCISTDIGHGALVFPILLYLISDRASPTPFLCHEPESLCNKGSAIPGITLPAHSLRGRLATRFCALLCTIFTCFWNSTGFWTGVF